MKKIVVIGDPVAHSLSPLIQSAALGAACLDNTYSYESLRVKKEGLGKFVEDMRKGEYFGANVTIPHKEAIIPFLDSISDRSKESRSVNTLSLHEGRIHGDSTDGMGCLEAFSERGIAVKGKRIAILGAGGSAHAVAFAFAGMKPARIRILNRSLQNASALAKKISLSTLSDAALLPSRLNDFDIVINCTPLGMLGLTQDLSPLGEDDLPEKGVVMDCIYNPRMTPLLKTAKRRGLTVIDGSRMLIHQGALSFAIWTGIKPDVKVMEEALRKALP